MQFSPNDKTTNLLDSLPAADPQSLALSERLQTLIKKEIAIQGGAISFYRFMELALYSPGLGYYSAGKHKFGEQGDFVTAPEISPLFSQCVARAILPTITMLNSGNILEVGAGRGVMAIEILKELSLCNRLPKTYFILELSADLRARQYEALKNAIPELLNKVQWLNELPENFSGIVLANELLDAMPVHLFCIGDNGPNELCVTFNNQNFSWIQKPFQDQNLIQRISDIQRELGPFPVGYTSEINLAAEAWLRSIASSLDKGLVLLFDYGFAAHEYYHPQRQSGTLMCHYQHRAHSDPLILIGLQDITAHINFSTIADVAQSSGLNLNGYTTQADFLITSGLTDKLKELDPGEKQYFEISNQIKKLTLPHEMGELFKVMRLSKQLNGNLGDFSCHDLSGRL